MTHEGIAQWLENCNEAYTGCMQILADIDNLNGRKIANIKKTMKPFIKEIKSICKSADTSNDDQLILESKEAANNILRYEHFLEQCESRVEIREEDKLKEQKEEEPMKDEINEVVEDQEEEVELSIEEQQLNEMKTMNRKLRSIEWEVSSISLLVFIGFVLTFLIGGKK